MKKIILAVTLVVSISGCDTLVKSGFLGGKPVKQCINGNRFDKIKCINSDARDKLVMACDMKITGEHPFDFREYKKTKDYSFDLLRCTSKKFKENPNALKGCSCYWDGKDPIVLSQTKKKRTIQDQENNPCVKKEVKKYLSHLKKNAGKNIQVDNDLGMIKLCIAGLNTQIYLGNIQEKEREKYELKCVQEQMLRKQSSWFEKVSKKCGF